MEPSTLNKKKTIISGLIVGALVLALGIGVYKTQNIQNPQLYKTQAAPVSPVENFLPKPGSTVSKNIEVQAKSKTTEAEDIKNLFAVVKIGDYQAIPLNIERLDPSSILLKGAIDVRKYPNGLYNITIYLYNNSSGKTKLVGSNQYRITIGN